MKRLTFKEENGKFGVVGMNEDNQDEKLYMCVKKLKDYEDLGLNPDELDFKLHELEEKDELLKTYDKRLLIYQDEEKIIAKILGKENLTIIGSRILLENILKEKDQSIEGLQDINKSLGQTCENDRKEIDRLERLVKDWSDECERRFLWKKSIEELAKELNLTADELELVKMRTGEYEDLIEDPIKINIYRSVIGRLCSLINYKLI